MFLPQDAQPKGETGKHHLNLHSAGGPWFPSPPYTCPVPFLTGRLDAQPAFKPLFLPSAGEVLLLQAPWRLGINPPSFSFMFLVWSLFPPHMPLPSLYHSVFVTFAFIHYLRAYLCSPFLLLIPSTSIVFQLWLSFFWPLVWFWFLLLFLFFPVYLVLS